MAKQTFTTGQVLTAAQMTSLQQTAMGGGSATAKTANYVLVAADAGTTVAMNAAGATTITVNTGLFAAGDTVFIQNLGAGACTVTAGTATVATAGSLILPQNDAGILYFTATGASIFYDFIQAGAVSPLTTKGDLYTFSTSDARLGVGANATVLTADSTEATGLKWAAPATTGANFTLLNSGGTALTGAATITVSGLTASNQFFVLIRGASSANAAASVMLRFNSDSGANYTTAGFRIFGPASYSSANLLAPINTSGDSSFSLAQMSGNAGSLISGGCFIFGANSAGNKLINGSFGSSRAGGDDQTGYSITGEYSGASVISSISLISSSGDFDAGTVYIYGG